MENMEMKCQHDMKYASYVTRHTSHITHHTSHITPAAFLSSSSEPQLSAHGNYRQRRPSPTLAPRPTSPSRSAARKLTIAHNLNAQVHGVTWQYALIISPLRPWPSNTPTRKEEGSHSAAGRRMTKASWVACHGDGGENGDGGDGDEDDDGDDIAASCTT